MSFDCDSDRISVLLGSFDQLLRLGLSKVLDEETTLDTIDANGDATVLERVVAERAPRVAVLDEESVAGLSLPRRLRAIQPTIAVVVLAYRPTRAYSMRLLAAGATCLAKDASAEDLVTMIHLVASGTRTAATVSLTPREIDVLRYLRTGQSHREVADNLQVGVETVRTHAARIRRKLGVHSKRELIGMPLPNDPATERR
jgi:DNA-binding NarL/FixJ family response regulator